MSVTIVSQPTMASQTAQGRTASTNVYLSAINTREWGDFLHIKYPEYSLVTLLGMLGYEAPVTQKEFSHFEMDRTREVATIAQATSDVSISTITATVTTSDTVQFIIPYDVVRLPSGRLAHVNAVSGGGGAAVVLTLRSIDPSVNFTAADFDPTSGDGVEKISQLYNLAGECFTAPQARTHGPEKVTNKVIKIPHTTEICDDEYNNTKEILLGGRPYWYYQQQEIDMMEHKKNVEMAILFGETINIAAGGNSTSGASDGGYGIIPKVTTDGTRGTYPSGGFVETDMIDFLVEMSIYSRSSEWLVLAGNEAWRDTTLAMRDYHVSGGLSYGSFGGVDAASFGLSLGQYRFNDKLVNFVEYKPFSDPKLFPQQNASIDYKNFMLFLNLGEDEHGDPYVQLRYRAAQNGMLYKMFKSVQLGNMITNDLVGNGNIVSTGQACHKEYLTTTVGVQMRGTVNHGMLYAA